MEREAPTTLQGLRQRAGEKWQKLRNPWREIPGRRAVVIGGAATISTAALAYYTDGFGLGRDRQAQLRKIDNEAPLTGEDVHLYLQGLGSELDKFRRTLSPDTSARVELPERGITILIDTETSPGAEYVTVERVQENANTLIKNAFSFTYRENQFSSVEVFEAVDEGPADARVRVSSRNDFISMDLNKGSGHKVIELKAQGYPDTFFHQDTRPARYDALTYDDLRRFTQSVGGVKRAIESEGSPDVFVSKKAVEAKINEWRDNVINLSSTGNRTVTTTYPTDGGRIISIVAGTNDGVRKSYCFGVHIGADGRVISINATRSLPGGQKHEDQYIWARDSDGDNWQTNHIIFSNNPMGSDFGLTRDDAERRLKTEQFKPWAIDISNIVEAINAIK